MKWVTEPLEDQKYKMMFDKLKDLSARNLIENDWVNEFIWSIEERLKIGGWPTAKQLMKIEEIFMELL